MNDELATNDEVVIQCEDAIPFCVDVPLITFGGDDVQESVKRIPCE